MTCRDFEQAWQARLDGGASPSGDETIAVHAASCAVCRVRDHRYRILAQALQNQAPAPPPSPGLADRVLARFEAEQRRPLIGLARFSTPRRARWAAAAAVLIAGGLTFWSLSSPWRGPGPIPEADPVAPSTRPLSAALTDATNATLNLALATSTPAARLGRMVLDTATDAEPSPDGPSPDDSGSDGGLLKSVGDRMATGIKPISGKARQAFGFLLSPTPVEPTAGPASERGRGA